MKTATVTWISYKNYGTFLQAFALQKAITSFGYENQIISDYPIVKRNIKNQSSINWPRYKTAVSKGNLIHRLRRLHGEITYSMKAKKFLASQAKFDYFEEKYLDVRNVKSVNDYYKLDDIFDCYVCGSDQIWSVLEHNFNEYFFLNFTSKYKIAYGPSIGQQITDNDVKNRLKELLHDFSAVSCREEYSAEQLSEIIQKNVTWVCDPTLLITRDMWMDLLNIKEKSAEKYLLCYFLENKSWYFNYARELAEYLKIKIMIIPSRIEFLYRSETNKDPIGPREFVALFDNAQFVLTDSYHGSIFSLLFNTQFIYLKRFNDGVNSQNIRIDSLFNYLGIQNAIMNEKQFQHSDLPCIDYGQVNERVCEFRHSSLKYLKESFENVDN